MKEIQKKFFKELNKEVKKNVNDLKNKLHSKIMFNIIVFAMFIFITMCLYATPLVYNSVFNWIVLSVFISYGLYFTYLFKKNILFNNILDDVKLGIYDKFNKEFTFYNKNKLNFMNEFLKENINIEINNIIKEDNINYEQLIKIYHLS